MKKLVIISWINFEQRINDLFAVEDLLKNGVEVEYWDVSSFTFQEHAICDSLPDKLVVRTIQSNVEFESYVKNNSINTIYACYMNYCKNSYKCYRTLTKYNSTILYCINGCQPTFVEGASSNTIRRLKRFIAHPRKIRQYLEDLYYNWLQRTCLIKPIDYLLVTCGRASQIAASICKLDEKTKTIMFNSTNYQQAVMDQKPMPFKERPYVVFLDEYMPFHPFVQETAGKNWISPDTYFQLMNKYLNRIEKKYNCSVVIAAHPIAEKYKEHNYFQGRSIFWGLTNILVKNSIGVITHNSTSINYAVIWKKPLIVIADTAVQPESSSLLSLGYANSLKAKVLTSINDDLENALFVNTEAYNEFIYTYITNKESESLSNSSILTSLLNN